MKKSLLLVLAMAIAAPAFAALTTGGTIGVPLVDKDGNGKLVVRTMAVDPSGTPMPTPATAPGSVPAIDTATTTQAFWTQTPVAYNLSTTAGVAGKKYIATFQPNFGGAGILVEFATLTWTAAINTGYGRYLPTTLTGGVAYGPYVAGFHAIVKASTATGVSGTVSVEAVP